MRGLLFLLSALFLLESTKGIEYEELDVREKDIVDKAIKQGNENHGKGVHLDFYDINNKDGVIFQVILRPTSCDRTTPSVHRKECKTEDKRPQVSCIDCKGTMEPCLLRKEKDEIQKRIDNCLKSHMSGASHILFQKGGNAHLTGCLGCI